MRGRDGECHRCARYDRGNGVGAIPFGIERACHGKLIADDERVAIRQRGRGGRAAAGGGEWHGRAVVDRERDGAASGDGEAAGVVTICVNDSIAHIGGRWASEYRVVGGKHIDIAANAIQGISSKRECRCGV